MRPLSLRSSSLLTLAVLDRGPARAGHADRLRGDLGAGPDRAKVLATLIPGTEDFYYWQCRERLDARDFATVRKTLATWITRIGRNARVDEIELRTALFGFDQDRDGTFAFLRQRFGWLHRSTRKPTTRQAQTDLLTRLDPAPLSPAALTQRRSRSTRAPSTASKPSRCRACSTQSLDDDTLHNLLGRPYRADLDGLPALIVRDLGHRASQGFGSLTVHGELRLEQLEERGAAAAPALREPNFVNAWLSAAATAPTRASTTPRRARRTCSSCGRSRSACRRRSTR